MPDSAVARRTIRDFASGLAAEAAIEADIHAGLAGPLITQGYQKWATRSWDQYDGWSRQRPGSRLTPYASGVVEDILCWARARRDSLWNLHDDAWKLIGEATFLAGAKLDTFEHLFTTEHDDGFTRGHPLIPRTECQAVLEPAQWKEFLGDLHASLITLRTRLRALPPLALPSEVHPPNFARLKDHVTAQSTAQRLTDLIDEGLGIHRTPPTGTDRRPPDHARWTRRCGEVLRNFLTVDVAHNYNTAVTGFDTVEVLLYSDFGPGSRSRFRGASAELEMPERTGSTYAAFVAVAVGYLAEVLDRMPDYAAASGQPI